MRCRANQLSELALRVRADSGRFWDNSAAITSLLNLLLEAVIERPGDAAYTQLDAASEFGSTFVGFDRPNRKPRAHAFARRRPLRP